MGVPAEGRRAALPRTPHPALRASIEAANARAVRGTALPPRSHKGRRMVFSSPRRQGSDVKRFTLTGSFFPFVRREGIWTGCFFFH